MYYHLLFFCLLLILFIVTDCLYSGGLSLAYHHPSNSLMKVLISQHILHVKLSQPTFFLLKAMYKVILFSSLYWSPQLQPHFSFETAKHIPIFTCFISLAFVYSSLHSNLYFQQPSGMTLTVINIDDLLIDHGNFIQSTDILSELQNNSDFTMK